ncbi:MAG: helix-turn-helix domain-containing protein [Actinomycetota bacterium]|nr:helix-turn-helix domain-containing protein [Actinomycetota bacterium]
MPKKSSVIDAKTKAGIGKNIKRSREQLGISQADLAGDRYISAYVSFIEAGKRWPSLDALVYFASRLGVRLEDIYPSKKCRCGVLILENEKRCFACELEHSAKRWRVDRLKEQGPHSQPV